MHCPPTPSRLLLRVCRMLRYPLLCLEFRLRLSVKAVTTRCQICRKSRPNRSRNNVWSLSDKQSLLSVKLEL